MFAVILIRYDLIKLICRFIAVCCLLYRLIELKLFTVERFTPSFYFECFCFFCLYVNHNGKSHLNG